MRDAPLARILPGRYRPGVFSENPWHWAKFLRLLGDCGATHAELCGRDGDGSWEGPVAGVPRLSSPDARCPDSVRVPLRALLREAFRQGARHAPLVDALADVTGWVAGYEQPAERQHAGGRPRVQIVVPVRGAHDPLALCLACVAAHVPTFRLTMAAHEAEEPAVSAAIPGDDLVFPMDLVTTPAPQSFAANVNLAAAQSKSEFVVLLNSDAYVGPGWLDALLAPFVDPGVVAVGPMGTNVSGHQGAEWLPVGALAALSVPGVAGATGKFRGDPRDRVPGLASPRPVYAARRLVGFCVAVRRDAWDRVGGMDEQFVNAYCDDDLSLRLSLVGRLVVVPDLLVLHEGQASFRELADPRREFLTALAENETRFAAKWRWLLKDWNEWQDAEGAR
jgi:hypothetical protein